MIGYIFTPFEESEAEAIVADEARMGNAVFYDWYFTMRTGMLELTIETYRDDEESLERLEDLAEALEGKLQVEYQ